MDYKKDPNQTVTIEGGVTLTRAQVESALNKLNVQRQWQSGTLVRHRRDGSLRLIINADGLQGRKGLIAIDVQGNWQADESQFSPFYARLGALAELASLLQKV